MGNFIAKAFVKCKKDSNRLSLRVALSKLNYKRHIDSLPDRAMYFAINNGSYRQLNKYRLTLQYDASVFIDCNRYANGDEDLAVKLFLALAEMDLNKPETLYYSVPNNLWGIQGQQVSGFIVKHCDIPKLHLTERHYIDKHNPIARPEELAEAVMRGDVKL